MMRGLRVTGLVFNVITLVFDALILGCSGIQTFILWMINSLGKEPGSRNRSAVFIFLTLAVFSLVHAVLTAVVMAKGRSSGKSHLVFSAVLKALGCIAICAFFAIYRMLIPDFYGKTYDPDHYVVLPLVILYCAVCFIGLMLSVLSLIKSKGTEKDNGK
jgi:hypothetical protein